MHYSFLAGFEANGFSQWVARRIPGCERGWADCTAMMVWDSEVIGGVVFHNYSPEAGVMEMSAAGAHPRWLTRTALRLMHDYIFDDAECQMAVLRVSERNKRMIGIAERVGYEKHLVPRLRGRDEAEYIMTLTDDAWRNSKFNKR